MVRKILSLIGAFALASQLSAADYIPMSYLSEMSVSESVSTTSDKELSDFLSDERNYPNGPFSSDKGINWYFESRHFESRFNFYDVLPGTVPEEYDVAPMGKLIYIVRRNVSGVDGNTSGLEVRFLSKEFENNYFFIRPHNELYEYDFLFSVEDKDLDFVTDQVKCPKFLSNVRVSRDFLKDVLTDFYVRSKNM